MPFNCDPCGCPDDHSRHEPTWRKAMITTICSVATAIADAVIAIIAAIQAAAVSIVDAIHAMSGAILNAIADAVTTITTTVYHVIIDEGFNHIGQVSIDAELPAGTQHIGQVCIDCEIPAGTQHIGQVSIDAELPAGTQNIGDVDIASMPAVVLASDTVVDSARKTVAVPGTQEQFASQACKRVDIMALPTNTDIVCVGGANVDAALLTRQGIALAAGQTYSVSVANTNILWVDAVVAGEGVCYNWFA